MVALLVVAGTGCTTHSLIPEPDPMERDDEACTPGATACEGTTFYTCGEDGVERLEPIVCSEACHPREGCVACVPGSYRCNGDISERCDAERRWARLRDCREWDSTCGSGGLCDDACAAAERSGTFAGCDFQITALPADGQLISAVVANLGADPNPVEIRSQGLLIASVIVAPRDVSVIPIPELRAHPGTLIDRSMTARLRSQAPVLVTQFQPFEPSAASADASLVLPRHALGRHHVVATYTPVSLVLQRAAPEPPHEPFGGAQRVVSVGSLTVVAPPDEGATIEVTPRAPIQPDPSGRVPAVAAGETLRLALAPGEAVQLTAASPPECSTAREGWTEVLWCTENTSSGELEVRCRAGGVCHEPGYDLSGTVVRSDRPVAVFGAHECALVPYDRPYCDRLEEQLPPVETWGLEHVSMAVSGRGADQVRVLAAFDGTRVHLDPPQEGIAEVLLDAGEWVEASVVGAFRVSGTQPILVAQYLRGQGTRDDLGPRHGDPSMWFVPPVEQYRDDYAISLPRSYAERAEGVQALLVVRPRGAWTAIDRVRVEDELISLGTWEVGLVRVGGGVHQIVGEQPFSLVAIGMSSFTSYATAVGREIRPLLY